MQRVTNEMGEVYHLQENPYATPEGRAKMAAGNLRLPPEQLNAMERRWGDIAAERRERRAAEARSRTPEGRAADMAWNRAQARRFRRNDLQTWIAAAQAGEYRTRREDGCVLILDLPVPRTGPQLRATIRIIRALEFVTPAPFRGFTISAWTQPARMGLPSVDGRQTPEPARSWAYDKQTGESGLEEVRRAPGYIVMRPRWDWSSRLRSSAMVWVVTAKAGWMEGRWQGDEQALVRADSL